MTSFQDFNNIQVAQLPNHLKQYIVNQNYYRYTPVDQAVWRFVMRQNYHYLKSVAYYPYIQGLKSAGLSIDRIPDLQTMNDNLGKLGWGAVTVDGFIPPAAFMEFQAHRVLVIAADIRQIHHIGYTPAPDIIHESAGHAPIIADPDYANYLSYFGSVGAKAMFSKKDFELYEAIRKLSILKEAPHTPSEIIENAEKELQNISSNMGEPSEMALLSRLHWWTVEYGLIGTLENPKIYGAGLLSSIGESISCMKPEVLKLEYDANAIHYEYDITKPQPQLFVTPNFQRLIDVLDDFANTMAFRKGGTESVIKAFECKNTCTFVLSSGIQLSGVCKHFMLDSHHEISFIKTEGPTALAFDDSQLEGHSTSYHATGFSSPIGKLKSTIVALENFTDFDLEQHGFVLGQNVDFEFESGITVSGQFKAFVRKNGKIILMTFTNCTVKNSEGEALFLPEWGVFDMAVGEKIISVFNGAADKSQFENPVYLSCQKNIELDFTQKERDLHELYSEVRALRTTQSGFEQLPNLFHQLQELYPEDWLCALEILELVHKNQLNPTFETKIRTYLKQLQNQFPENAPFIEEGLAILETEILQ